MLTSLIGICAIPVESLSYKYWLRYVLNIHLGAHAEVLEYGLRALLRQAQVTHPYHK